MTTGILRLGAGVEQYFALAKPRVVALIVFTAMIGMIMADLNAGLMPAGGPMNMPMHH